MSDIYEVERIVDKKIDKNGRTMYFIKWKDWDESTNTWEPESNLTNAPELLAEFNATWKGKDNKNGTGGAPKSASKKTKKNANLAEDSDAGKKVISEMAIPEKCGFDQGYVAEKIVGATDAGGTIKFLVKWKDKNDVELITNERARKHCPQLVIKFYEQNITWDEK